MRFICLKASELDHAGRGTENAVRAHRVVGMLLRNAEALICLGLRDDAPLDLNLVLTVGWRLVSEALFKLLASFVLSTALH